MPQNIYDNPDFFAGYKQLRDTASGLNEVLEQPALRALLPDLTGLSVLELGCGMGQFARWCVEHGAALVTAVDVSEKMLDVARRTNALPQITYIQSSIEDWLLPEATYDIVVSSLALHYVADNGAAVENVFDCLKPHGWFLFCVEHPLMTAHLRQQNWVTDEQGRKLHWPVDHYHDEGKREYTWFVDGVVKYHRTTATYVNTLITAGFQIERLEEPQASAKTIAARPDLAEQSRRPPFLIILARRAPNPRNPASSRQP